MAKKVSILKLSDGSFRKYRFYSVAKFIPFVKKINPPVLWGNIYNKESRKQIAWFSGKNYIVHYT